MKKKFFTPTDKEILDKIRNNYKTKKMISSYPIEDRNLITYDEVRLFLRGKNGKIESISNVIKQIRNKNIKPYIKNGTKYCIFHKEEILNYDKIRKQIKIKAKQPKKQSIKTLDRMFLNILCNNILTKMKQEYNFSKQIDYFRKVKSLGVDISKSRFVLFFLRQKNLSFYYILQFYKILNMDLYNDTMEAIEQVNNSNNNNIELN